MLIRPPRLLSPPSGPFTIQRASPQAAGLVAWFPFWGKRWDMDGFGRPYTKPEAGPYNFSIGPEGPAHVVDSDTQRLDIVVPGTPNAYAGTVSFFTRLTALPGAGNQDTFLDFRNSGNGITLLNDGSTNNRFRLAYFTSFSSTSAYLSVNPAAETFYHVAFTWFNDAGSNLAVRAFINGWFNSQTTGARAPWAATPVTAQINQDGFRYLYELRIYNRILSDAEIWQLFSPETRFDLYLALAPRVWFVPAAGGGPTTYYITPSGAFTPAGAMVKQAAKFPSSSLALSGAILKQAAKYPAGSLPLAGAVTKQSGKAVAGSLPASGGIFQQIATALAGMVILNGALTRQAGKSPSGVITPSGSLAKQVGKLFSGALAPSGALALTRVVLLALAGVVAPAGALVKQTGKAVAGTLVGSGGIVQTISTALAGAVAPMGGIVKAIGKSFPGALTPTGSLSLSRVILLAVSGALAPAGALFKQASKAVAGLLPSSGGISKEINTALSGSVSLSGGVRKSVSKAFGGALAPIGALANVLIPAVAGLVEALFKGMFKGLFRRMK